MSSSVLSINGRILAAGYNKEEADKLVTDILKRRAAHSKELGVLIVDLYMPSNSAHESPLDAIHDFVQIVRAHYTKRQVNVVWKKDTVSHTRYRDRRQFNDTKLRYRVVLILDHMKDGDYEFVYKYALKTWSELHGFRLKDAFRVPFSLGGSSHYDYVIRQASNEPVELTISYILSYINPLIKPKLM